MRRRYVLKNKRRFVTMLVLFVIISVFTGFIVTVEATSEGPDNTIEYETAIVQKGDTLWEIALRNNQNRDLRAYIFDINKLNNLESGYIYEGQVLILP